MVKKTLESLKYVQNHLAYRGAMNKARKIVAIGTLVSIALLFCLAFCGAVQADPGASISVTPASVVAEKGEIFTINITVDPSDAELYGAQYILYFDPALLNATAQTQGTLLSSDGKTTNVVINTINNSLGKLEYAESRMGVADGVTSPGVLASVSFEVIGTSGTSDFLFSDVMLVDANGAEIQPVTLNVGSFSIPYTADGGSQSSPSSTTPSSPSISVKPLTVEQAYELLQEEPGEHILVDSRTAEAYATEHIAVPGVETRNIPESEFEQRYGELEQTKKIIVYDQAGSVSRAVGKKLVEHGFESVYTMLGGFDEWKKMHYPTTLLAGPTATPTTTTPTPPLPTVESSPEPTPATGTPTPEPTGTHPTSPTTGTQEPGLPGFELSCAILGMLAIAVLTLKLRKRV